MSWLFRNFPTLVPDHFEITTEIANLGGKKAERAPKLALGAGRPPRRVAVDHQPKITATRLVLPWHTVQKAFQ